MSASVTAAKASASRGLILGLVLVAQFMVVLDATIVTVALPEIQAALGFETQLDLQWIINAYILLFGGFLLLGGRAGDLFGRQRLFVMGLGLFTGASLVNGLAESTGMLIAGRAVQGLGAALVAPAVLSILVTTFSEEHERAKALGVFSAVTASASAAGLLLGGILTDVLSWRWIFLVNVPIGLIGSLLALRFIPNTRANSDGSRAVDLPGAITVTGGLGLIVFGLVNAQSWGWSSGRFAAVMAGGVALLLAFAAIESRAKAPLVRLGIFRNRHVASANAVMFLQIAGQFTLMFFPTLYMQEVFGYSPIKTGFAYVVWPIAMMAAATVGQKLLGRFPPRVPLVLGIALVSLGLFSYVNLPVDGTYVENVLPGMLLTAVGAGLSWAAVFLVATSGVEPDEAGLASGLINTSQQIGSAVGLAALATIAAGRTADLAGDGATEAQQAEALVAGFERGFLIAGIVVAVAGLVALLTTPAPKAVATLEEPDDGKPWNVARGERAPEEEAVGIELERLAQRVVALPGAQLRPSALGDGSGPAIVLREDVEIGAADAFLSGRDVGFFGPDGSVHLALPPEIVADAVRNGWATRDAYRGTRRDNVVVLHGPRDERELETVLALIAAAVSYAAGSSALTQAA